MEDWAVWQMVDSGLPTGGFAHSLGLEAAVALGFVRSESRVSFGPGDFHHGHVGEEGGAKMKGEMLSLFEFIEAQVESIAAQELPFVFEAHQNVKSWEELDHLLAVKLHVNPSAFRASTAQGNAFIRLTASGLLKHSQHFQLVSGMQDAVTREQVSGQFAPLFGTVCRLIGISSDQAQKMFLFIAVRDMVSAAKRLALVGSFASVELLTTLTQRADSFYHQYKNRNVEDSHQTFPVGDVLHSCHGDLFRKLFLT